MEVFYFDHENVIRAEKSTVNGLRECIKKFFRVIEISLVLVSLTWASTRLPFAVKISGDFFRKLLNVVAGHLFIFLLSNVLALTLFIKFRHQQNSQNPAEIDFCQEFIENIDGGAHLDAGDIPPLPMAEVVYQDKQTILVVAPPDKVKVHRRSHSEITERKSFLEEDYGERRISRSETTERKRRVKDEAEMVDELSNEEFQKTIEAFIAKQIEFHQQEKVAIVVHG